MLKVMDWLYALLLEIAPLYIIAVMGFMAGKLFTINIKTVATLAIYFTAPVVVLITASSLPFTPNLFTAIALVIAIAIILCFILLKLLSPFVSEKTRQLLGLGIGTSNYGYFGLPVAFAVFGAEEIAAYIILGYGLYIYENTIGLFMISKGEKGWRQSLKTMATFPGLYAAAIGISLSGFGINLVLVTEPILDIFKGAFTFLGMAMIGIGLSQLERFRIDLVYVGTMLLTKFIFWPLSALGLVWLDKNYLNLLEPLFYMPLILLSIMPMAANNITFAAQFDNHPGKASMGVVVTTLFSVIYIPLALKLLGFV